MKRNILFALIPVEVVIVCCSVIMTFNWSHDLYQYVGANKAGAEILAAITAAALVLAAVYIGVFSIFKDKA